MKTQAELELEFRGEDVPNFPSYNSKLEFRPLRNTDARLLAPVFRTSAKSIRTYLSAYQHADRWWLKDTQAFVSACVNDEFPAQHWIFTIGNEVVALGSLHSFGGRLDEVQVVLAVFGKNQGRGLGTVIAKTLKKLAFEVWGFQKLWWIVDATNFSSMKLAQRIGCVLDSTFEQEAKHAEMESGLWHRFVIERDPNLAAGILQGASIDYWSTPKTTSLLKAVVESNAGSDTSK